MQTIGQWLEQLGLFQYAETFERNAVDLDIARDLTQEDLRDLGVEPLGHRKVLLRAIGDLNGTEARAVQAQSVQDPIPAERSLPAEAERRQLTVLFCDLVGSTELSARLDPEELREVLHAYHATCASAIAKYDGHIAQYLGDGLLVYFGYPHAHEDDAPRAVRTGLAIVEAMREFKSSSAARSELRLAVRFGIHTGLVVGEVGDGAKHELLALGETPNLAARLQAIAESDAIVISGSTHRLVRGLFQVRDLGPHVLKGSRAPMPVYQALLERTAQSRVDLAMTIGVTHLIGREREAGLLLDRWEQVAEGHAETVLLSGEAGIGKSRLVQVLKDRIAPAPHTLLECRCSPYYQHSQLHPIIELLQQIFGWAADDAFEVKLRKLESRLAQYGCRSTRSYHCSPPCFLCAPRMVTRRLQ
jgi:class 3 adenylate cyclase